MLISIYVIKKGTITIWYKVVISGAYVFAANHNIFHILHKNITIFALDIDTIIQ